MFGFEIVFDKPAYLLLLLLIPGLWVLSFRSLAGLGRWRRIFALVLRTVVLAIFVFALAEVQYRKTSEKLTVIYLLDQSQSIPTVQRQAMLEYAVKEVSKHRNRHRGDLASVVVFGREAIVEVPPFDDDLHNLSPMESQIDFRSDATNLAAAMKVAQSLFPEGTAKRIVIVSDGNENVGNAREIGRVMADNDIGIDVVPVKLTTRAEVAVEKVSLPNDIRQGQPFEATVVLNNYAPAGGDGQATSVPGKLTIYRKIGKTPELISEQDIVLPPGKHVYRFQQKIDEPAVYEYIARFTPADPKDDLMSQNNEASNFSHIRGKGRVLLVEDFSRPGDFDHLVQRLRVMNIEVDVIGTDNLFTSLAQLQGYDCVVLANVPRSSGETANSIVSFSDEQIQMLVRNTEQMGCGLVMLGGAASFGAGGWANTELEKAMPVDFVIKNAKIQAVGALVLLMHASEMAQGNHWQKLVGYEAIKTLGPLDYCGVIHWNDFGSGGSWLWGGNTGLIKVGGNQKMMLSRISRMTPGDMPEFDSSIKMSLNAYNRVNASVKHMILISDGDPAPPTASSLAAMKKAGVQISTVAIGTHGAAGSTPLQNIATVTGGKYYVVNDPKALPRIYQKEVRRVARPLIKNLENVAPQITQRHEMLQGIEAPLPPLKGFVMTTVKDNPLVEVSLVSPDPPDAENATVLASWTFGLGRAVVFTTDAGKSTGEQHAEGWASSWLNWPDYDKFFSQMIRWSMRPIGDQGKFTIATNVKDGEVHVTVTALTNDDEFLNFLNMSGSILGPNLEPSDIKIEQVAPGRYVAKFPADKAGSYFVNIHPGGKHAPILAGVNVPYSSEFRDHETNVALLTHLAGYKPKHGQPGELIDGDLARDNLDQLLKVDTFRHNLPKAISTQGIWPLFMLAAACLFFADVFVRRVTISWEWLVPVWAWIRVNILRRQLVPVADVRLERLRNKKAAITKEVDERRAAARFAPVADPETGAEPAKSLDDVLGEVTGGASTAGPPRARSTQLTPGAAEEETYTARLLKAKQKAKRDTKPPLGDSAGAS